MKSFADWTTDIAKANNAPKAETYAGAMTWDEWLDSGCVLEDDDTNEYLACCQGCGEWTVVECEAHEFDPAYHYCNGSPRCTP